MVYFISNGENIKIGYTSQDIEKRLHQLNTGSDTNLYLLGYMQGNKEIEKQLHLKFGGLRIRYNAEWFKPSDDLIDYINDNSEKPNTFVSNMGGRIMVYKTMNCA